MSIADFDSTSSDLGPMFPAPEAQENNRALQRIREVREQQGVSLRGAARSMHVEMRQVRAQEDPEADLLLSDLYLWQRALGVPVADLLVDVDAPLSSPVLKRAQMLRLMKTIGSILANASNARVKRLAQMAFEQLVEIMPELKEVSPWHEVGQRRTMDEYGRTFERRLSDEVFRDRD